ncbi:hypothetical protein [Persicitalea sp.]|uniref:hypothetical protein n=1 Tax=Persicitalea sp. TaxID=3100273 RepID=UPI00359344DF
MREIVQNYMILCKSMESLIKASGYKNVYLAEKLGMPPTNFSAKKKRANWTPDEVDQILAIIDNEELEDYFMVQLMEEDIEANEPTIPAEEFNRRMGWS